MTDASDTHRSASLVVGNVFKHAVASSPWISVILDDWIHFRFGKKL